jgi:hypothetical protein
MNESTNGEFVMKQETRPTVLTPQDLEKVLNKLPYTAEELIEWERWGNYYFGTNNEKE